MGIANQGESCLAWDARTGEPLSPVIVWQDSRTLAEIERLRALGAEALTRARCGLPLDAYFSASKLGWMVNELPQVRSAQAAGRLRLGTTDAWFLERLTGEFATDVTTASRTSLMNLHTRQWDPELCQLFGVPIEVLPSIRPSVGDFGSYRDIPVTASVVDQQASLYGHGCRLPGEAKITFGTGAFALALSGERIVQEAGSGLTATVAWELDDLPCYAVEGGVYDASSAVEWAQRLGLFERLDQLSRFDAGPAISRRLAFVPALSGLACPHWDRRGAALWIGMDAATRREDLCQALLEGIALRAAEVIAAMDAHLAMAERLSIDGGLSRNPYFVQFFADVLQRAVVTQRFDELTAFGCAALAGHPLGIGLRAEHNIAAIIQPRIDAATAADWRQGFSDAVEKSRSWR